MDKSQGKEKELDEILKQLKKVYKGAKESKVKLAIKTKLMPHLLFRIANC